MTDEMKKKVLLVDDEKMLLDLYALKFLKAGYDVFECQSVDEGIEALRNGYKPDAILFDISMPEKDGYVFLDSMAKEGLAKNSLKVALTNEGQDGVIQRIEELGADAHILKVSLIPAEVVERVTKMLKERQAV